MLRTRSAAGTLPGVSISIDHRHVARVLGIGRVAIGTALLLAPRRFGRGWVGESAATPGAKVAFRALGARDVVLGYGLIHSLDTGDDDAAQWLTLAALCDVADAVATLGAARRIPRRGAVVGVILAGGAAAAALVARDQLD
jgi:hypothetical protein